MPRHLDHISDGLLREINEDIHELNNSLKESRASLEALQNEQINLFSQHFENLQKLYIELSESAEKDIKDETAEQLKQQIENLQASLNGILDTKAAILSRLFDDKIATFKSSGLDTSKVSKKNKVFTAVLIFFSLSLFSASFVAGSYLEQSRYNSIIQVLPYINDNSNGEL